MYKKNPTLNKNVFPADLTPKRMIFEGGCVRAGRPARVDRRHMAGMMIHRQRTLEVTFEEL